MIDSQGSRKQAQAIPVCGKSFGILAGMTHSRGQTQFKLPIDFWRSLDKNPSESMSTEAVHLAAGIKRTCREWFDANLKEDRAELVPNVWMFVLYSELTQVEMHLFMEAVANPADPQVLLQHELQHRGKRIAAIDEIIRKYPDLEKKLRPDLDHLWKIYR